MGIPTKVCGEKEYVEGYAQACWDILIGLDIQDGYCKSYDPLTIDENTKVAHSYVFNLWDGGRHHSYENMEQIMRGLEKETLELVKEEYVKKEA